jgi:preprotein translocase subunit SecE
MSKIMSKSSSNSRIAVFLIVLGLTAIVWFLRGVGLFAFIPGLVLWVLILLSIVLAIVNGLLETR